MKSRIIGIFLLLASSLALCCCELDSLEGTWTGECHMWSPGIYGHPGPFYTEMPAVMVINSDNGGEVSGELRLGTDDEYQDPTNYEVTGSWSGGEVDLTAQHHFPPDSSDSGYTVTYEMPGILDGKTMEIDALEHYQWDSSEEESVDDEPGYCTLSL